MAAEDVLVLVLSRDLGSAVVFFITYVVMLYVATKSLYILAGLGSGALAASCLFSLSQKKAERL